MACVEGGLKMGGALCVCSACLLLTCLFLLSCKCETKSLGEGKFHIQNNVNVDEKAFT